MRADCLSSKEQLQNAGEQALDAANHVLAVVDTDAHEVASGFKRLSGQLVRTGEKQKVVAEKYIREARDVGAVTARN